MTRLQPAIEGGNDHRFQLCVNIRAVPQSSRFADGIAFANGFEERIGIQLAQRQEAEVIGLVHLLIGRVGRFIREFIRKHGRRNFALAAEIDEGQRNINLFQALRFESQRKAGIDQYGGADAGIAVLLLEMGLVEGSYIQLRNADGSPSR